MDPVDLHEWVHRYNWDDGIAPMWSVVESSATQYATALLIYWRLGGPWLESDSAAVNTEAKQLQIKVKERILTGFYPPGPSTFDPLAELSRAQLYKLRRAGVPELLLGGMPINPE